MESLQRLAINLKYGKHGSKSMKIIKVNEYIYQFEFIEDMKEPTYITNITVVIDEARALIIDTGYIGQGDEVASFLEAKGVTAEIVAFSHFHPDHIYGGKAFPGCKFIGSKYYKQNFEYFKKLHPENKFIVPEILVDENYDIQFGTHKISFVHMPGHSECTIVTIIDEKIIYVADLILNTTEGKTIIPYVCEGGSFEEHISSLNKIMDLNCDVMLLAHGHYIKGNDKIKEAIEDRLYYLNKVKESNGTLKLRECVKSDLSEYRAIGLHRKNLKRL